MKRLPFLLVVLFSVVAVARADQDTANAQQILKDQGYYYGAVNGTKDADTSAAIRRYQIRNGLEITGELNAETLQSLRKTAAAKPTPAATLAPLATPPPPPAPANNQQPQDDSDQRDNANPNGEPYGPSQGAPPDGRYAPPQGPMPQGPGPVYPGRIPPPNTAVFSGTPYETAPPPVQQKVIVDAQRILANRGLLKGPVDGNFGPDMEFSLRAYQSKVGLPPTGRLDLETLAALELLPGRHDRIYTPRRGYPASPLPPVRGEWIRP